MGSGRLNTQGSEKAFQVLLGGLLTMKADRIERAPFLDRHDPVRRFKVVFRFTNPLPEYFDNLRPRAHAVRS